MFSRPGVLRRSLAYASRSPGLGAGALGCLLSGTGLVMAGPLIVRRVIDEGISARDLSRAGVWSLVYLAIELFRALVEPLQAYLLRAFSQATSARIRADIFQHLQSLPLRVFDRTPAGELAARSTSEVATVGEALSAGLLGLFRDALVLVLVVVLLLSLGARFGAMVVACSLLAGVPALFFRRTAQERSSRALGAATRMNAVLEENLSGRTVIRLFGLEGRREQRFREESDRALEVAFSTLRTRAFFDGGATVTSGIALCLILWLGGIELGEGRISAGLFVALLQYGSYMLGSLRGTAEKFVAVLSGIAAGKKIFETLSLEAIPPTRKCPAARSEESKGLSSEDLHFGYGPGKEVIRGIVFRAKPGERIALVGKTGAGKTTFARLLSRLYDPWSGAVRLGARDLREIPPEELRRRLVYVTQQVSIFHGSLFENIRLGDPRIGRAEVERACRELRVDDFLGRLPCGLDAPLGEGGVELSAGERQLVSFARILVRAPDVLLLDEPTANIDPETEELLLRAMDRVLRGTTSLVIAHRPSTLEGCDRILVMKDGMLEEPSKEHGPFGHSHRGLVV